MGIIKAIDLALAKYKDRYGNKKFEEGKDMSLYSMMLF